MRKVKRMEVGVSGVKRRIQADSCCQAGVLATTICSPHCGELSMLAVGGSHSGVLYRLSMCCKLGKTTEKLDSFGRSQLLLDAINFCK